VAVSIKSMNKSINKPLNSIENKMDYDLINNSDIEQNGLIWASIDNFKNKLKDGLPIIINTDVSTGQGIHWIVLTKIGSNVFIIDSLGRLNKRDNQDILDKTLKELNLTPIYYNGAMQYMDSNLCGYFSIINAYNILKLNELSIKNITKMLDDMYGADRIPDEGDIKVILEHFKKYEGGMNLSNIKERIISKWNAVKNIVKNQNRMNYPPEMRNMLMKYGDKQIQSMQVCRRPLISYQKIIDIFKSKSYTGNHDKFFHLYMKLTIDNKKLKLDKNADIRLRYYDKQDNEECINISIPRGLTINMMLNNTINKVGRNKIFIYSALDNNCQQFIIDLLNSNNIKYTKEQYNFIIQNVNGLLNKRMEKIAKIFTTGGNIKNQLIEGYGCKQ
jgi:hypothetical protein